MNLWEITVYRLFLRAMGVLTGEVRICMGNEVWCIVKRFYSLPLKEGSTIVNFQKSGAKFKRWDIITKIWKIME